MTPKEKAQELITKFSPLVTTWDCYWDTQRDENLIIDDAKQCALIAVNEILETLKIDLTKDSTISEVVHFASERIIYWEKVKQEIEKL